MLRAVVSWVNKNIPLKTARIYINNQSTDSLSALQVGIFVLELLLKFIYLGCGGFWCGDETWTYYMFFACGSPVAFFFLFLNRSSVKSCENPAASCKKQRTADGIVSTFLLLPWLRMAGGKTCQCHVDENEKPQAKKAYSLVQLRLQYLWQMWLLITGARVYLTPSQLASSIVRVYYPPPLFLFLFSPACVCACFLETPDLPYC